MAFLKYSIPLSDWIPVASILIGLLNLSASLLVISPSPLRSGRLLSANSAALITGSKSKIRSNSPEKVYLVVCSKLFRAVAFASSATNIFSIEVFPATIFTLSLARYLSSFRLSSPESRLFVRLSFFRWVSLLRSTVVSLLSLASKLSRLVKASIPSKVAISFPATENPVTA